MNERELLQRLGEGPVSGDALARAAGQTRAAVWKRIEHLRDAGVAIDARAGRGYALAQPLDLLDAAAIEAMLPAEARRQLASLEVAWSIDSSNSELLRRTTPAHGSAVLLAESQTGGRGRRGRAWRTPLASGIAVSVARHFDGGLARLGGLSLVAGIAVAEALREAGYRDVGLKWPNDLVAGGRKLGGLLVEGGGEHGGPARAVVGLGLNVRMPVGEGARIDQPWTDLASLADAAPSRNAIAARVLAHLLPALERFDREGLPVFLDRYAALDALQGREVVVDAGSAGHAGTALGIAGDGALRVAVDGAERVFHAGDVSVRGR